MPRNSRIHQVNVMSNLSDENETGQSLYGVIHEVGRQDCPGDFELLSDTAIEAMFAPCEAWLRMVQEYNSGILKTYKDVFWSIPAVCVFHVELIQRSFMFCIEIFGLQSKAVNLPVLRIERSYSGIRGTEDSIERAMDIAIGADREPRAKARTATAA